MLPTLESPGPSLSRPDSQQRPDSQHSAERRSPLQERRSPQQETEQQVMMRRLWKSDELIKQLKHIVKAQHGKIEELRERLEFEPAGLVRTQMANQDGENFARVKEDNEELRRHIHRGKAEIVKHKAENTNLKKINNRLERMLQQQGYQPQLVPRASQGEDSDEETGEDASWLEESFQSPPAKGRQDTSPPRTAGSARSGSRTAPGTARSQGSSPGKSAQRPGTSSTVATLRRGTLAKCTVTATAGHAGLPGFSKLWRLSSVLPMFWRDLKNAASILKTLVEIASRLLEDGPSASFTIYMVDSWLRSAATDPSEQQPALFYMGQGKTTVQVFRSDGARSEPPKFQNLHDLPTRTRSALAVAVVMPSSRRNVAMLQVTSTEPEEVRRQFAKVPKELATTPFQLTGDSPPAFTDSHLMHLQMVCTVAGGILEQVKDSESKQSLLDRMHACVDVSVAINQARSLPDFEQRVKHLLGKFFGVTTVRVLFFEPETNELLISSAQMGRKGLSRLSLEKGVVGLCAKRQQVVHVTNISHHPYIDAAADGLQRSGRPISSEASTLVGPLVIESVEGARLVGVVQLLERKKVKNAAPESAQGEEFTSEEQSLFNQLLRVCAQAAWRTLRVQQLTAQVNNDPSGLEHMLAG